MVYKLHTKITWSGIFGGAANPYEAWSFGLNVAHNDGTELNIAASTAATDALGYGQTFVSAVCHTNAQLTQCKVANIGPDGKYTGAPLIALRAADAAAGTCILPPQVAMAVSTWSAADEFPRIHGRFYVPSPVVDVNVSTGLGQDGQVLAMRDAALALVHSLNNDFVPSIFTGGGAVVIASAKGAGSNHPVKEIRVGHAFDTIRSRRTSMIEAYVTGAVT